MRLPPKPGEIRIGWITQKIVLFTSGVLVFLFRLTLTGFLPSVILLLLFLIGGALWIKTTHSPPTQAASSTATDAAPEPEGHDGAPFSSTTTSTESPSSNPNGSAGSSDWVAASPPSWRPSAVFGKQGTPAPQKIFPRGENASRRYQQPVRKPIDPALASQNPTVLARSPQDGRFHFQPEQMDEHTKKAGRLVFDPAALDQVVAGQTSRILAPTLTEEVLTLEFETVKTRSANTHTLHGYIAGEEETSTAQFVYHDGIVHGNVMRYDAQQEIEYRIMSDGHMMVREIDTESFAEHSCATCESGDPHSHSHSHIEADIENQIHADLETKPAPAGEEPIPVPRDTTGWRTIDVTVGYSTAARIDANGTSQMEAKIIASVDRMSLAFANSQINNTEIVLLGTIEETVYVEPGDNGGRRTH